MAIQETDNKVYTYNDYLNFSNDEIIEIIDGKMFERSTTPSTIYQELIMEISAELRNYVKANNGQCKVYPAPFDVVLIDDDKTEMDIIKRELIIKGGSEYRNNFDNCIGNRYL